MFNDYTPTEYVKCSDCGGSLPKDCQVGKDYCGRCEHDCNLNKLNKAKSLRDHFLNIMAKRRYTYYAKKVEELENLISQIA